VAVEMILNDLSLLSPVSERGRARNLMTGLIGVLSTAALSGIKILRTKDSIYNIELSDGYPISSWLNDNQVEREQRSFLRTLQTKTPLLIDITDLTVQDQQSLTEFKHQGESAYSLGIAYLLNGVAISFCSEPKWDCPILHLEVIRIAEEDTDLTTDIESLIHASRSEHILTHKVQIQNRLREEPWSDRDEILPCYTTSEEKKPLSDWLNTLDETTREIIHARLNQVKRGTLGDFKSIGEGVQELRIFYGPGYRVYFGHTATNKVLLLWGGDKSTQVQDIAKSKRYWQDYKEQECVLE
jgi:putative addiction module killer protein